MLRASLQLVAVSMLLRRVAGYTRVYSSTRTPLLFAARVYATTSPRADARAGSDASSAVETQWRVNLLYDSDCPLCMKEVEFLRKRDVDGRIKFTDLASLDYSPEENGGVEFETGMKKIHAVLPNNEVIEGVEVFRKVYEEVGLGWVYAVTRVPILGQLADSAYDLWARHRLQITGRRDLAEVLKERQQKAEALRNAQCTDECEVKW